MTGDNYDLSLYDSIYIYHGNDFSGALNLFGGLKNYSNIDNFIRLSKFNGKIYSLVIPFPNYREQLTTRMKSTPDYNPKWNDVNWKNIEKMETCQVIDPNSLIQTNKVSIGDSHAISMYRPGWANISVPYKTLYGALKQKLDSFIPTHTRFEKVEFYFGNIDIRHHLCRLSNIEQATKELVSQYVDQCREIIKNTGCKITLYEPLPIEDPSRVIPKSGFYKGTAFYGSWEERNVIRKLFRDELLRNQDESIRVFLWVDKLIDESGKLDFECMEKPKSVHLSRKYYPHWQGLEWNERKKDSKVTLEDFFV
jgi:hypothetical protein